MPDFQCATASAQRAEPIFATASQVKRWLLVEVRGSWGEHAIENTDLGRHVDDEWRNAMRGNGVRVIAIRRDLDRAGYHTVRLFFVDSVRRTTWTREIAGLHVVPHATEQLPRGDDGAPGWTVHDEPLVLVCTNGRHDPCCARYGRPVVRSLRDSAHSAAVWECSHIGGDRFAGNVVVLPDGFYFGRCDAESGVAVVDGYRRGELVLEHYRGCSRLTYMQQAAEFFVRRDLDAVAANAVTAVRRVGDPADGNLVVELADRRRALVTVKRHIGPAPTRLTCKGNDGVTFPSYELIDLRVEDGSGTIA